MTVKSCPRLWEVEAAHGGRLEGAERAQQREHQKTCRECGRMARSLLELKQLLVASEPPIDELALRRLRQTTLQRAAAAHAPRRKRLSPRLIVLALAAALGAVLVARSARSGRASLVEVISEVEPSSWSRHHSPQIERVTLREGLFSVSVRRRADDPRVLVEIPEGEVEDVGTVFSVTVHDGRTTRIAVNEGAVLLRRAGLPELRLLAGSVWQPVPKAAQPAELPLMAAAVRAPPVQSMVVTRGHAAAASPSPPLAAGLTHASPARAARARATSPAYTALPRAQTVQVEPATSAQPSRSPQAQADAPLAPPPSAAAPVLANEDACYLEFVHLLQEQRTEAARRVGRDYLRSYPRGFRRPDVERALHDAQK